MYHYTLFSKEDSKRIEKIHYMSPSFIIFNFKNDLMEPGPGSFVCGNLNLLYALDLDSGDKIDDLGEMFIPFEILFSGKKLLSSEELIKDKKIIDKMIDFVILVESQGSNIMN
jgi:hypothetical protein